MILAALIWWPLLCIAFLVGAGWKATVYRRRLEAMAAHPPRSKLGPGYTAGYRHAIIELLEAEGLQLWTDNSAGHP